MRIRSIVTDLLPSAQQKIKEAQKKKKKTTYDSYTKKIREGRFDEITAPDLLELFVHCSYDAGVKFVVGNHTVECSKFKNLMKRGDYSTEEIVYMVEFLFLSDQDYLPKNRLSPGIFFTTFCNDIYEDMKLWREGKYVPKSKKNKVKRESKYDTTKVDAEIGVDWD